MSGPEALAGFAMLMLLLALVMLAALVMFAAVVVGSGNGERRGPIKLAQFIAGMMFGAFALGILSGVVSVVMRANT